METLKYILNKFNLSFDQFSHMPLEIPNFGRNQLAQLFMELSFTIGAEIGVERGEYSEILLSSNPNLVLYSIDPWRAYRGYRDHTRQEKLDKFYSETIDRLFRFQNRSIILKNFSLDIVKDVVDESLDFVYLDGNHDFYNVTADIHHWLPKIRPGGILVGHDYTEQSELSNTHVYEVVNAYTDAYMIHPWFVFGLDNEPKNWMWVKQ